jgi:hypothetical protein
MAQWSLALSAREQETVLASQALRLSLNYTAFDCNLVVGEMFLRI